MMESAESLKTETQVKKQAEKAKSSLARGIDESMMTHQATHTPSRQVRGLVGLCDVVCQHQKDRQGEKTDGVAALCGVCVCCLPKLCATARSLTPTVTQRLVCVAVTCNG